MIVWSFPRDRMGWCTWREPSRTTCWAQYAVQLATPNLSAGIRTSIPCPTRTVTPLWCFIWRLGPELFLSFGLRAVPRLETWSNGQCKWHKWWKKPWTTSSHHSQRTPSWTHRAAPSCTEPCELAPRSGNTGNRSTNVPHCNCTNPRTSQSKVPRTEDGNSTSLPMECLWSKALLW